jgi:hypothetical protein
MSSLTFILLTSGELVNREVLVSDHQTHFALMGFTAQLAAEAA